MNPNQLAVLLARYGILPATADLSAIAASVPSSLSSLSATEARHA
jgi:hypothetical protein